MCQSSPELSASVDKVNVQLPWGRSLDRWMLTPRCGI